MAIYKEDIVSIELSNGAIHRNFLNHSIGTGDNSANRFGIRVFRNGSEVDLSGVSCQAYFKNAEGTNIALTSYGTVSGNVAYVTLPQACYNVEGQFCLAIKLIGGGVTGTMRIIDGMVCNTGTTGAVAPTSSVPTYQEILSTYEAMVSATSAANLAIAETFDASKDYPAGKNVINDGALYVLPNGHTAGTTWANTTKVASNLGDQVSDLNRAFDSVIYHGERALFDAMNSSNWVVGNINTDGTDKNQSTFIRLKTANAFYANKDCVVKSLATGAYVYGHQYSDQACTNYEGEIGTLNYQGKQELILPANHYYRLRACYAPASSLTNADIPIILAKFTAYETTTITELQNGMDVTEKTFAGIDNGGQLGAEFTERTYVADTSSNLYNSSMLIADKWIGPEGAINNSNGSYYAKIPVFNGESYTICYHGSKPTFSASSAGGYLIQDKDGNTVKNILAQNLPNGNAIDTYDTKVITIPKNGAYLLITIKLGTSWDNRESFLFYRTSASGGKLAGLYGATIGSQPKWKDLKWVAFGDSLTESNLRTDKNYHGYIADTTGITVVNMGKSGTGYKRTYDEGFAFYQRILNVSTDADVITIFGSGNDLLYISNLGTPADEFDPEHPADNTLCACINKTIENLYSVLPTVQLGIVTPCPWQAYNPSIANNDMDLYSQAIVQICKNHGIPCLDLYHCSSLRPWEASYRELCYSKDEGHGTHPNELGHKILSSHFEAFLETLISTY